MKVLGYVLCALAAIVGALMIFDQYLESPEQIWDILNGVICVALAVCVIIGIRDHVTEGKTALSPSVLVSVFAFLVFSETWVTYMASADLAPMVWMWVDAIAAVALLGVGIRLIARE